MTRDTNAGTTSATAETTTSGTTAAVHGTTRAPEGAAALGAKAAPDGAAVPFAIGRLNHVALVVEDLAAASATWRDTLGATVSTPQPLPEHGVTVVFVDLPNTRIELLEPLGDGSPVSRFLERHRGGGMHHVCLEVGDIRAARDALVARGARVLGDGEPRTGAHGNPVLFLHPGDLHGTLVELEEVRADGEDASPERR